MVDRSGAAGADGVSAQLVSEDLAYLAAKLSRLEVDLAEARYVAWLLWRDLRERELRGPSALRVARTYPWINRSDGEVLE